MNNNWIQTFTGKQFWPLDPKPEDVCIEDIAHALSMICRFNGHCNQFYSVSEHSVLVSQHVNPLFALKGLLHDASEAYISDLGKPIKKDINGYKAIENRLQQVIFGRFKIWNFEEDWQIKQIDQRILVDEQSQLMPNPPIEWSQTKDIEPLGVNIECWQPGQAKTEYIKQFNELTGINGV